ncbi:unnamed protein product [Ixodes persulcatus]
MGRLLRTGLSKLHGQLVREVRGKGLLNAIVLAPGVDAKEVCLQLMKKGVLAQSKTRDTIRLAPPLVINEEEMRTCIDIITETLTHYRKP